MFKTIIIKISEMVFLNFIIMAPIQLASSLPHLKVAIMLFLQPGKLNLIISVHLYIILGILEMVIELYRIIIDLDQFHNAES